MLLSFAEGKRMIALGVLALFAVSVQGYSVTSPRSYGGNSFYTNNNYNSGLYSNNYNSGLYSNNYNSGQYYNDGYNQVPLGNRMGLSSYLNRADYSYDGNYKHPFGNDSGRYRNGERYSYDHNGRRRDQYTYGYSDYEVPLGNRMQNAGLSTYLSSGSYSNDGYYKHPFGNGGDRYRNSERYSDHNGRQGYNNYNSYYQNEVPLGNRMGLSSYSMQGYNSNYYGPYSNSYYDGRQGYNNYNSHYQNEVPLGNRMGLSSYSMQGYNSNYGPYSNSYGGYNQGYGGYNQGYGGYNQGYNSNYGPYSNNYGYNNSYGRQGYDGSYYQGYASTGSYRRDNSDDMKADNGYSSSNYLLSPSYAY